MTSRRAWSVIGGSAVVLAMLGGFVLAVRLDPPAHRRQVMTNELASVPGASHTPAACQHPAWHRGCYISDLRPSGQDETFDAIDRHALSLGWRRVGEVPSGNHGALTYRRSPRITARFDVMRVLLERGYGSKPDVTQQWITLSVQVPANSTTTLALHWALLAGLLAAVGAGGSFALSVRSRKDL